MIDLSPIANPRNREILRLRLQEGMTLEVIAGRFSVTRERIRQLCNWEIMRLSDEDIAAARAILARQHTRSAERKAAIVEHRELKQRLRAELQIGFNPARILETLGLAGDPELAQLSEIGLCELIYDQFFIGDCFKYIRCTHCKSFKLRDNFTPKTQRRQHGGQHRVCRECNTRRGREYMRANPAARAVGHKWQADNPNRCRIFVRRFYLKKIGRPDLMPPVPPRGVDDSEIAVPPSPGLGPDWWAKKTPEERERIIDKRRKKYYAWLRRKHNAD